MVDKKGTRALADAYLRFLYTPAAQEIIARNHYRPRDPQVTAKYAATFGKVTLFTIDEAFGGWQAAQRTHFADRGIFQVGLAHLQDPPPHPSERRAGLPREVGDAVLAALAKEPARRPSSASAYAASITTAYEGSST